MDLADRLAAQRKAIEQAVDEAVRRALSRVRVPTQKEVQALNERLDSIVTRIEALTK